MENIQRCLPRHLLKPRGGVVLDSGVDLYTCESLQGLIGLLHLCWCWRRRPKNGAGAKLRLDHMTSMNSYPSPFFSLLIRRGRFYLKSDIYAMFSVISYKPLSHLKAKWKPQHLEQSSFSHTCVKLQKHSLHLASGTWISNCSCVTLRPQLQPWWESLNPILISKTSKRGFCYIKDVSCLPPLFSFISIWKSPQHPQ